MLMRRLNRGKLLLIPSFLHSLEETKEDTMQKLKTLSSV